MLPFLGVNQYVKMEWRQFGRTFGEIGLLNLLVEQFIRWMEIMLQHYHTGTTFSDKITALIAALQLEIGSCGNLLNKVFLECVLLATDCWIKAVWERACFYKFRLDLGYVTHRFPRELDQEIVDIFLTSNVKGKDFISLNRCRIAHEAIFLSCKSTGEGTHVEQAFPFPLAHTERQST
jgi:hypothetical protein